MKFLLLALSFLLLSFVAYAQLNTFKEGDVISAEQMNENFQALEQQFQGALAKNVNCAAEEKIADAIANGYTNITVSGTCTENLQFSMWREDSAENGTPTGKLAPRFLRIAGADASAKIVDSSSNTESTVSVNSSATLFLENITVSGGEYGVNAQRNSNLYLSGVTVENFTESGIRVADSAWLGIDDDGATLAGTGAGNGINLATGSSGWISTITISDVDLGIRVAGGSMVYLKGYSISAASRGISIDNSRVLKYGDGSASIEGTSDRAVSVSNGVFTNWEGTLEIKNLKGGRGLEFSMSQGIISNLNMSDFDNTGSGWNPAISLLTNSSLGLGDSEISGSTDGALVQISDGSIMEIRDSTLTAGSASNAIEAYVSSLLTLRNSTISGSVTSNLVRISGGSSAEIRDSTITISSAKKGLVVWENSHLRAQNLTISGTTENYLIGIETGANAQFGNSDVSLTSSNVGLYIADGAKLNLSNSKLSGSAPNDLVRITRASSVMIESDSSINQTSAGSNDISVSYLSLLTVDSVESPINSVNCYNKGYVSADEGSVTDLATSCTE